MSSLYVVRSDVQRGWYSFDSATAAYEYATDRGEDWKVVPYIPLDEAVRVVERVMVQPRWDDNALDALEQVRSAIQAIGKDTP